MGRIVNKADYTFNKVAKTITFSSTYTGLELAQIQLITDVTNNTIIYQFNKPALGGSLAGLVLTLTYNTNTVAFNNTDDLMIIINESEDNTQLYSGTISAVGPTTAVLTTDQQTLSIQLSGTWEGIVMVEGSNDGTNYIPLMVLPVNELSLVDSITEDGIFNLTTSTKFVRLNVVQLQTGSITALILGRTIDGPNAADALSIAMDRTQNTPLTVQEVNALKRDTSNALVTSDVPYIINVSRIFATNDIIFLIDTTGYQSVDILPTILPVQCTITVSNDGINWVTTPAFSASGQASPVAALVGANIVHSVPCTARYMRCLAAGGGSYALTLTLRNTPAILLSSTIGLSTNINSIGGIFLSSPQQTNPSGSTAGFAGLLVGSLNQPGTTTVNAPIIIGGRQAPQSGAAGGIVRTMLMDPAGRVLLGAYDQTKLTTVETPLQTISANFENGNSLSVTDLSQHEGQRQIDILAQVLTELRIMNQYMHQLPLMLNGGYVIQDEPNDYRNEQSALNI